MNLCNYTNLLASNLFLNSLRGGLMFIYGGGWF